MNTKNRLTEYISLNTGWHIEEVDIDTKMPLHIRWSYILIPSNIEGVEIMFAIPKESQTDMRIHYSALRLVEELTSRKVVLVFEKLKPNTISSLISKQIPFVLKDKQIYMPFVLTHVKTIKISILPKLHQKLTPHADTILVGYLSGEIKSAMIIKEIAQLIGAELRASSMALEVLESLGYLSVEQDGICKKAYFKDKIEVYEKLFQESLMPIKYVKYSKEMPNNSCIYSGSSALANFSNILDDKIKTVAISYKDIKSLDIATIECEIDEADYRLEIWDRNPSIFAHSGCVNPIYILRMMRYAKDERVSSAILSIEREITKKFEDER